MKAVVTVTGKDNKGIIAKVSTFLCDKGANIEDISQTVLGEYFAMIMLVDITEIRVELSVLAQECAAMGKEIGMAIYVQHEDIFNAMHTI